MVDVWIILMALGLWAVFSGISELHEWLTIHHTDKHLDELDY